MAAPGGSVSRRGKGRIRRVVRDKEGSSDKKQSSKADQSPHGRASFYPANGDSIGRGSSASAQKVTEKRSPRLFSNQSVSRAQNLDDSPDQLKEFLTTSLSEVASSEVSRQAAINYLATENGLTRVKQIVETKFSARYSVTTPMFNPHCLLFLRLITQKDVLQSLAVEKAVGTIYNVIYGLNGKRAISFFQSIMNWLEGTQLESGNDGQEGASSHMESLLLMSKALLQVLTVNQGAAIKTEFKELLESLSAHYIPSSLTAHDLNDDFLRQIYDNIHKIADILAMGDRISITQPNKKTSASGARHQDSGEFEPIMDFPGDLSENGPRHDNDLAAIENIRLLPTLDEICSQRKDFLPTRGAYNSPNGHHQEGICRLIDSQFRLLREDTAGLLRDAVRMIAEHWTTITHGANWGLKRKLIRYESPTPMRIYYGAQLREFKACTIKGLEVEVEFDQLHRIKRMSPEQRKKHWINSRGLKEGGGLVALVDAEVESDMNVVFLQVSKREMDPTQNKDTNIVRDLISNSERAMVTLRFPSIPTKHDIVSLISMNNLQQYVPQRPLILVEFPTVQYNQFEGVLRCLQTLHKNPSHIPFTRHLTVGAGGRYSLPRGDVINFASAINPIPPPRYLRHAYLDLSSIMTHEDENYTAKRVAPVTLPAAEDSRVLCQRLCELSSLDSGQAEAMVSALTHEIALIQGPPGTGKSYVGIEIAKCLLKNKEHLGLGPLLCVCYTNHALDQFLHELVNSGLTRILRIGSRSPSDLMESFSLDTYKKNGKLPRLTGHGRRIQSSKATLEARAAEIGVICRKLRGCSSSIVAGVLQRQFPAYEVQIREEYPDSCERIEVWIDGNGPGDTENNGAERSINQLFAVGPWTLTNQERSRVYHYCYELGIKDQSKQLHELIQKHVAEKQHYTSLFTQSDAQIFDQVDVVGVTTTGLANNSDLLRTLQAKVLICEEAGEVLESHLLTALLPSVEHAILIGDHLQLRPRISRLHLSMEHDSKGPKYNLDESLFERLAKMRLPSFDKNPSTEEVKTCEFPVAQLDHQRRMHPCISSLIRHNLYPKLKDHQNTTLYPEVAGVKQRLFWLDHENDEDPSDPDDPMRSKTNTWEAEMVTALASHLCRQGEYKRGDIAILTPYVGQLRIIKDMLENVVDLIISENDLAELGELEDEPNCKRRTVQKGSLSDQLRIATVDNFQGEEATVVIISLVRSNKFRNCGFLKTSNRINVLLSRAKHGMYIIGNARTFCHIPMWGSVIRSLEEGMNIGPRLELQCPRHISNKLSVSSSDDFSKYAPEGGCSDQCGLRLKCGHTCTFKCHQGKLHDAVKCMASCTVLKECGHLCQKKCHEPCGDCTISSDIRLSCGHTAQVQCRDRSRPEFVKCMHTVVKTMPLCGHEVTTQCSKDITTIKCAHTCDSLLPCGHECRNNCWSCRRSGSVNHGACTAPCGRQFTTCAHNCSRPCHDGSSCPPCQLPCEVRCVHNKCPGKCSDPCPPCAESCGWACSHREHRCKLPCAVPCDLVPCNNRCDRFLKCGHLCPGACGEKCPDSRFCHQCGDRDVLERPVEFLLLQQYADIDVDKDPVIFLSCGHFYTRSTMDEIMRLKDYYEIDPVTEDIVQPKPSWRVVTSSSPPGCPECRSSLRDIHRYNRIVKRALLDEATRRFVSKAHRAYMALIEAIQLYEDKLESERSKFVQKWLAENVDQEPSFNEVKTAVDTYDRKDDKIKKRLKQFIKSVSKIEQPFGRVNALLTSAIARDEGSAISSFKVEEAAILTGFHIRGDCLHLRLSWAILLDNDKICQNTAVNSNIRSVFRNRIDNRLPELLEKCRAVREESIKGKFIPEEVQAMLYYVLFLQLSLNNSAAHKANPDQSSSITALNEIKQTLAKCEDLYSTHQGTLAHLKNDIDKAKIFCNGGTFYSFVTTEEKRQVYEAMAAQFQGTGHWYYCRNNHPFTVGECGLPMEEARCPQCGERVGGHDHTAVPGVRAAEDLEAEFGRAQE